MQSPRIIFPTWVKIATVVVIIWLAVLLLRTVGGLINPFIWALITAYLFNPVVSALNTRLRIGRIWGVLLLYIVGGGVLVLGFNWLAPRLANQYSEFVAALPSFAVGVEQRLVEIGTFTLGERTFRLQPEEAEIQRWFAELGRELPASLPELVFGVLERLVLLLVYLVVTFYLLVQADQIFERLYHLIPLPYRDEIRQLGRSIDRVLGAYIRSQLLLIAIMAVLTYIALSILGVKYALVLAIATGFLEIIPFVGPYTAAASAMTVALLQGTTPFGWPVWLLVTVVGVVYLVLRQLEDHLIIPNLVGHIVELHPVIVIFSILAGGAIAGALGLLLAVPVAAAIRIILTYLYSKLIDSPEPQAMVQAREEQLLLDPSAHDDEPALDEARRPTARPRVYHVPEPGQRSGE
jgi:predicted PurR-regulated permease PerM